MKNIFDIINLLRRPRVFTLFLKRKPVSISSFRNVENIKKYGGHFNTIIDVGANIGQFALAANYFFPNSKIYSFEPSKTAYEQSLKLIEKDGNIELFDFGLGDIDGEVDFYENSFNQISSFSKIDSKNSNNIYKRSKVVVRKTVIKKLDSIIESLNLVSPVLLKLDVQGLEDKVLTGAEKTLEKVEFILLELAFERLYENQLLFNPMNMILNDLGYALVAPVGFNYGDDKKIIEIDALYRKKSIEG